MVKTSNLQNARARRDALDRAFLDAQAGLLAQELTEGAPCPVCGSTHHPKRAVLPAEAPTQARVDAARQSADEADRAAQEASAAAAKAVAADREAKATLRRDAEALLPERFTSSEGPVKLTVSLLKTALAEESEALHAAQEALDKAQKQNAADLAAKARQEDERQKKTAQRSALEAEARASAEEAARQSAAAKALEAQCAEARAALPAADREEARRALAGLGPELVLPQLRAQTVQELLAQPGGAGCELCGTLQTLTGALTQCVRRRPGWLYAMFPSGITCPVPARPALVQAAVLEALRPVLACGGQAVLEVKPRSRAVLLCLRGGAPAGVLPLWQALARQSGGAVVFDSGAQFAAAAFLPLCPGCRIQKSPSTQELLEDRFSLPYLFLSGYCAGPW